jgi:hypothetical protein
VFIRRLLRQHADGTFREEPQFLPMNLKWSHTGEVFASGISPRMGQFCDVGHIVHPNNTNTAGHAVDGLPAGTTVMCLNVEAATNTRTHLLTPSAYRLELLVGAANVTPISKTVEIQLTGRWFDETDRMFADGVGFREV